MKYICICHRYVYIFFCAGRFQPRAILRHNMQLMRLCNRSLFWLYDARKGEFAGRRIRTLPSMKLINGGQMSSGQKSTVLLNVLTRQYWMSFSVSPTGKTSMKAWRSFSLTQISGLSITTLSDLKRLQKSWKTLFLDTMLGICLSCFLVAQISGKTRELPTPSLSIAIQS